MRVLCLFFPRLALQVALREKPQLVDRPVVLISGHGDSSLVAAASREASVAGVLPGMTAGQARQRCPGAAFLPDTAGDCLATLERTASLLRVRATPLVEPGGRDHLFLDLGGLPGDERVVAGNLASLIRAWTGFEVRAGIAPTRAAALEAARPARGLPAVLPPGEQATEPPITAFAAREVAVTLPLRGMRGELAFRAAVVRALGALQPVLEGRRESFRSVAVEALSAEGAVAVTARIHDPLHDTAGALDLLAGRLGGLAVEGAAGVRVVLAALGPDVRVRPCAAGRMDRGVRPLVRAS